MASRFETIQQFLRDVLLEIPASSVDLEKSHSNLQVDITTQRNTGKSEKSIQRDSYIMSAVLEHENLKDAVETVCFGSARGRVARLLKNRATDTNAMNVVTGQRRCGIDQHGCVKTRQRSLLKGLLLPGWNSVTCLFYVCVFEFLII